VADGVKKAFRSGRVVKVLDGKLLACLFMEPSTRTSCSFLAAVQKLGGTAIMVTEEVRSEPNAHESASW
jgi:aspartate carbamoyltransferase catalytic subunit